MCIVRRAQQRSFTPRQCQRRELLPRCVVFRTPPLSRVIVIHDFHRVVDRMRIELMRRHKHVGRHVHAPHVLPVHRRPSAVGFDVAVTMLVRGGQPGDIDAVVGARHGAAHGPLRSALGGVLVVVAEHRRQLVLVQLPRAQIVVVVAPSPAGAQQLLVHLAEGVRAGLVHEGALRAEEVVAVVHHQMHGRGVAPARHARLDVGVAGHVNAVQPQPRPQHPHCQPAAPVFLLHACAVKLSSGQFPCH
mmetsp:Transcript_34878/g.76233  ORF Transcript_34878/g.76233 Transcript_34878/m.76233 type:complete len:246 (+) Transcript_34878:147-884(+)